MNLQSTPLGRRTEQPDHYDTALLCGIERGEARGTIHLPAQPPFAGYDVWHAYEASCLFEAHGDPTPACGILKLVVPANSPRLVESKSLKLYLNSYNMEVQGSSAAEALAAMQRRVAADLTALLGAEVKTHIFDCDTPRAPLDLLGYGLLERGAEGERVATHLLRSRCPVTGQPDFGSVYLSGRTATTPLPLIVGLRAEAHFHEQICELLYSRLRTPGEALCVTCLYTRRGGIDICPTRAANEELLPAQLIDVATLTRLAPRS